MGAVGLPGGDGLDGARATAAVLRRRALLPAIGVPITPFFLLAGATFGVQTALIGSLIALAANMAICYWIGRSGLRPRLIPILSDSTTLPDFEPDSGKSFARSARFTTMVGVTPGVPGLIKNYGLGAARVPFGIFLAWGSCSRVHTLRP